MENQTSENIFNSAVKNYQKGDLKLAAKICHKILERDGENSQSLHLLGVIAGLEGQPKEAVSYLTQAVKLNPNNAEIHSNLGLALKDNQQLEAAIEHYQKALELKPNYAEPYNGLGMIFLELGKLVESQLEVAIKYYQKSLELKPNYVEPYNGLGNIFLELGRLVESQQYYQQALKLDKNHANAHFGLAVILLKQGNFIQGFNEYEWRWQKKDFSSRNLSQPLWDGSNFQGKTLLVYTEQGLGDSIQFIRYIPLVKKLGGRVIVELNQAGLKLLFTTVSGIDELFIKGEKLPDFDLQISLMSLPRIFQTTLETIPAEIPYLSVPKLTYFPIPPAPEKNLKVGIFWQTSSKAKTSQKRSCPVQYLQEILSIGKANFYILQKEVSSADLEWLNSQTEIHNLGSSFNDLADTAAAIQQLDLVITIDTVIAHLAGALGKPVWILLPFMSDWRWMLDRNDSPWYPTARLFRQAKIGDWDSVFIEVKQALIQFQESQRNLRERFDILITEPKNHKNSTVIATIDPNTKKSENLKSSISERMKIIAIGWPLNSMTGWGIYGINLTLQLLKTPGYQPLLLIPPQIQPGMLNPLHQALLTPAIDAQRNFQNKLQNYQGKNIKLNLPVLQALGSNFSTASNIRGTENIGIIFSENTQFTSEQINRSKAYDLIITGSTWNSQILESNDIKPVQKVLQGIDQTIFHPAPKSNIFRDRFVVFSGGKLEYRKGQDIIIAAFKIFQKRHSEALLITAWHNFWPQFMTGIEQTGNVVGLPKITQNKRLQITEWLRENDIPSNAVIDVGPIPNYMVGQIVREADVAVFTNRCEGGTNLVAMESLACGVPTIISANTGHLDIINDSHCYPLSNQNYVKSTPHFSGVEGWGESDVEEVVEMLEKVYYDQEDAQLRGKAAVSFMQNLTWEKQIQRLLFVLKNLI